MTKIKPPKPWRATVNLDRLEAATGRWRITTGKTSDPLPRAVANDEAVRASIVAWMSAHQAKKPPEPAVTEQLEDAIRTSVTTAFRAMPPELVAPAAPAAPAAKASAAPTRR
jgi:hypothetical protein